MTEYESTTSSESPLCRSIVSYPWRHCDGAPIVSTDGHGVTRRRVLQITPLP